MMACITSASASLRRPRPERTRDRRRDAAADCSRRKHLHHHEAGEDQRHAGERIDAQPRYEPGFDQTGRLPAPASPGCSARPAQQCRDDAALQQKAGARVECEARWTSMRPALLERERSRAGSWVCGCCDARRAASGRFAACARPHALDASLRRVRFAGSGSWRDDILGSGQRTSGLAIDHHGIRRRASLRVVRATRSRPSGAKCLLPQACMATMTGWKSRPRSVRTYSWRGGRSL